jgi:AP endonuclease-2
MVTSPALKKGQSSLKGFFQTKQQLTPAVTEDNSDVLSNNVLQPQQLNQSQSDPQRAPDRSLSKTPEKNGASTSDVFKWTEPQTGSTVKLQDDPTQAEIDYLAESESVVDPIVAKEGWTKLFTKRQPPRCEGHNEPCISLETKKKGFNCGRSFWICARYAISQPQPEPI